MLKDLTNTLPGSEIKLQGPEILDSLQLADPNFHEPGKIDVLLGADVYEDIMLHGLIKGINGLPMAQQTELGWILSGKNTSNNKQKSTTDFCHKCGVGYPDN